MQYKDFIEIMKELIQLKKDEDKLNDAFRKFEPDFNYISFGRYETLVVKTLEKTLNTDWIGYFLYECDCGKRGKEITDRGKSFKLKTLRQLWRLINN